MKLEEKVALLQEKCARMKEEEIDELVKGFPPRWEMAIRACISAAKAKTANGRRFTTNWIYECQLLRIKSLGLYKKMLRDNFLPLPSLRTLQRYMKKLKPAYGFQTNVFELLKEKSQHMPEAERHGELNNNQIFASK